MKFSLTEEQELLRKTARDFLAAEDPASAVRALDEDEKGYSPELWQKMADLGWLGLAFPAKYGGAGGSFLDLTVLLEAQRAHTTARLKLNDLQAEAMRLRYELERAAGGTLDASAIARLTAPTDEPTERSAAP